MLQRIRRFFEESYSELKKVTWPTREQVRNLTVLVFVVSAAVGVFIALLRLRVDRSAEGPHPEPAVTGFLDHLTEKAPDKRWYVIHTYSGYEKKVKTNLEHRIESMGMEDKIFQVLVPEEDEIEIRGGQRVTVQKKVYPGYVLVEMILDPDSWFVVRNTPGVTSFVGGGNIPGSRNEPIPLEEHEVKQILRQMGVETPKYRVAFQKGQSVRVTDGPVRRVHRHRRRGQPRAQQGQGAGQHLRPRDARGAGLPPDRETVSTAPDRPCAALSAARARSRTRVRSLRVLAAALRLRRSPDSALSA